MNALKLSDLEESLLINTAILDQIYNIMRFFPKTPRGHDEKLKFILNNALIVEICKFQEEFGNLGRILSSSKSIWILKVLEPLYKPIKNKQEKLRFLRNRNLVHRHRDDKGRFIPAIQVIRNKNIPTNYAEILFLGQCVSNFIIKLREYLKEEVRSAEEKYKEWLSSYTPQKRIEEAEFLQMKSIEDIKGELDRILKEVHENEQKINKKWKK